MELDRDSFFCDFGGLPSFIGAGFDPRKAFPGLECGGPYDNSGDPNKESYRRWHFGGNRSSALFRALAGVPDPTIARNLLTHRGNQTGTGICGELRRLPCLWQWIGVGPNSSKCLCEEGGLWHLQRDTSCAEARAPPRRDCYVGDAVIAPYNGNLFCRGQRVPKEWLLRDVTSAPSRRISLDWHAGDHTNARSLSVHTRNHAGSGMSGEAAACPIYGNVSRKYCCEEEFRQSHRAKMSCPHRDFPRLVYRRP